MSTLGVILKTLGVKVPDEAVRQLEIIIPQVPARLREAIEVVNATITKVDERMKALEGKIELRSIQHQAIMELLIEIREEQRNGRNERDVQRQPANGDGLTGNNVDSGGTGTARNRRGH